MATMLPDCFLRLRCCIGLSSLFLNFLPMPSDPVFRDSVDREIDASSAEALVQPLRKFFSFQIGIRCQLDDFVGIILAALRHVVFAPLLESLAAGELLLKTPFAAEFSIRPA